MTIRLQSRFYTVNDNKYIYIYIHKNIYILVSFRFSFTVNLVSYTNISAMSYILWHLRILSWGYKHTCTTGFVHLSHGSVWSMGFNYKTNFAQGSSWDFFICTYTKRDEVLYFINVIDKFIPREEARQMVLRYVNIKKDGNIKKWDITFYCTKWQIMSWYYNEKNKKNAFNIMLCKKLFLPTISSYRQNTIYLYNVFV